MSELLESDPKVSMLLEAIHMDDTQFVLFWLRKKIH